MDNEQIPMFEPMEERAEEKREDPCPCACYIRDMAEKTRENHRPLTPFSWVGVNLLMLIPLVNILFLFLWACGGTERTSLKNYARGILLTVVFLALVFLVSVVVLDLCGLELGFPKWLNSEFYKY